MADHGEPRGILMPDRPALVTFGRDGRVKVTDVAGASVIEADGIFGAELRAYLETGVASPMLEALGDEHPVTRFVASVDRAEPLALDPAAALRLDGFDTLFVELLGRCNERCQHCYAGSSPDISAALDRETVEGIVDDAAALGFGRIQLTGGDPLLCSFLPAMTERASAAGLRVEIYTNGLALTARLLEQLAPAKPSFAFSFYSHDPATHDSITRTPGSQRRTADAIKRVVDLGLGARAAMVVMPANASHEAETVRFLREDLGVGFVSVTASFEVGRGDLFEEPIAHRGTNAHAGPVDADTNRSLQGKLCVTYEGDVVPCIFNRDDVVGSVTRRRLRDIAREPSLRPLDEIGQQELLTRCSRKLSCWGCRLTACALQVARGDQP